MRTPKIADAMNYIDDDLVSWAIEYRRVSMSICPLHKPFGKVCVCFLLIALIYGVVFCGDETGNVVSSPFILTAYAISPNDGSTITNVLEKNIQIPISRFVTENGLTGFVVSYNKLDDNMSSSITIIATDSNSQGRIAEISGITNDLTQNYYFYVPGETEVEPYMLPLFLKSADGNLICQYKITITQIDGSYYAELVEESIMERITK